MKRLQRSAVILSLIEALLQRGNWGGETHIQKATYFLQDFLRVQDLYLYSSILLQCALIKKTLLAY